MAIRITVEGMHCGGCVTSVRNALQRAGLPGVTVEVGHARLDVQASDDAAVNRAKEAIVKAGFVAADVTPEG